MTLVIGVVCEEGIVIGSDSQTTMGGELKRINRPNPKVLELDNNCIVFAGAGDVCVLQEVEDKVNTILEESNDKGLEFFRDRVDEIIFQTMKKHVEKHGVMFGNYKNMPTGDFVFSSCKNKIPLLCHFAMDGSSEKVYDYIAVGSGMPYAEVLLKDSYREKLSLDDSKYLVYSVIRDTEDVDNFVGGEIHIKIIKLDGCIETITNGEISALATSYSLRKDIKKRLDKNWERIEPKIMGLLDEEETRKESETTDLLTTKTLEKNKKNEVFN